MSQILVVDDEIGIRELLSEILADEGHSVQLAENAERARALRGAERPDLVLLDIWMPDTDGITLLKEWAANGQLTMPVVMMSGHGTIETAVEATRIGAIDFLEKPITLQKLLATVKRALRDGGGQTQIGLTLLSLGRSAVIADLRKRLAQIATLSMPVLLRGEPGVMPELFARYLHQPNTPWVVAGAALADAPQELLAASAGGLIFVEELATLTRAQQKNLAFILGKQEKAKSRLISFTAEEPARLAADFGFDAALLARLSELSLALPALREHAEDIPDIASILLAQLVEARNCPPRHFSTAALNALRQFHWPGNLQDLQGAVKNLALTALEEEIGATEVERVSAQFHPAASTQAAPPLELPLELPLREAREAFERAYFEQLLAREAGSIARVAEKSGLERTHLYRKLKALGITASKKEE
ncbi:MAG: transcriptional regulator [Betaproteobacteria bacterium RIFCSPLOWO2_12_FULL_64_23]|nr:MAG: transcriptional regulator [Betaproteobacteria bacterium RIFCSPLOWO2_12_FULL_64_23]